MTESKPSGAVLSGIRVLDATDWVSGPAAGLALAQLGADVVKIERPERGDPFRNFGLGHQGVSAFWTNINHGKRSVMLNLREEKGLASFRELASAADILIQNWRPGKAEAMGLGDEALAAVNSRLIRVAITGFGPTGPLAKSPAFDGILQARSGIAAAQGRGGRPDGVAMYLIDKLTAVYSTQAILAALIERGTDGPGCRIDVAMLDVAAHFNFPDLFQDRTFMDSAVRLAPNRSPVICTADGHIVVVPVSGKQIGLTCEAVGHPEWISMLKAIRDPSVLIDTLYERLETVTGQMTTAEALSRFAEKDVPAAPVLDQDAHLVDAQVQHNGTYFISEDAALGPIRRVHYPALFDGKRLDPPMLAPTAGQHNEDVFADWLKS
ncbi:CaiB/BaiF CoA transferase family protein [Parasphingorhabdus sp.]|uniref:CaiB/BaiF CoA transferase family protein n=1 Tax=Parasphingorhabdus sp. TaxID=2709688 RepID=UPI003A93CD82